MKRIFSTLFTLSVITIQSFSQVEPQTQLRATLLPLGIDIETRISDTFSLNVDAGLLATGGFSITTDSNGTETNSSFGLNPLLQASLRHYYNFEKRGGKGKKITGNSANYVGILTQYLREDITSSPDFENALENYFSFGAVWGLQRTYDSNIYLDLNIGLGYANSQYEFDTSENGSGIDGIGSFAIGYAFGQE